jgi:hypothetical protein
MTFIFSTDTQSLPDTLQFFNAYKGTDNNDEGSTIEPTHEGG